MTAGGCANHPTHENNPAYLLTLDVSVSQLLVELKGPKQYQIGIDIMCVSTKEENSAGSFSRKSSGPYRFRSTRFFFF